MRIEKIINNNVVNAIDDNGTEIILTGKGIGFQQKKGALVDINKIEKIFRPDTPKESYRLEELFKDTPIEYIVIATECIEYGKKLLKKELNSNLYITMIEHLNLVVERQSQGIVLSNPMLWDLKHFYPQEFEAAEYTRKRINEVLSLNLTKDESGFLTMHFLNAENESSMPKILDMTHFLQEVIRIIEQHFEIELNADLYEFGRFVTHLKYLFQRIEEREAEEIDLDDELFYRSVEKKHQEAYECVIKIVNYIENKYQYQLPEEEKMYLTVYIKRILIKNARK